MMLNKVVIDIVENIGVLSLDRPPVNAINHDLIIELTDTLNNFQGDDNIKGIILTGQPGCFSAGLDIVDLFPKDKKYMTEFWGGFS